MPTTDDEIREKYLERAIRELNQMTRELQECPHCPRGNLMPVLGSGHPQADILMLKHAPISAEIEEGVAFYGRAGNALMKSFKRLGIDPLVVYGTLCVKCPIAEPDLAADECVRRLVEEIAIVQPKIVVIMGEPALRVLNGLEVPLSRPDRAPRGRGPGVHADDRRALHPRRRRLARRGGRQAALLASIPNARQVVRGPAALLRWGRDRAPLRLAGIFAADAAFLAEWSVRKSGRRCAGEAPGPSLQAQGGGGLGEGLHRLDLCRGEASDDDGV